MPAGLGWLGSFPFGRPKDGGPASAAPPPDPASTIVVPPEPPAPPADPAEPAAPPVAVVEAPPVAAPPVPADVAPLAPPEPVADVEELAPVDPLLALDVVAVEVGVECIGLPWSEQAATDAANETQTREGARLVMLSLLARIARPSGCSRVPTPSTAQVSERSSLRRDGALPGQSLVERMFYSSS